MNNHQPGLPTILVFFWPREDVDLETFDLSTMYMYTVFFIYIYIYIYIYISCSSTKTYEVLGIKDIGNTYADLSSRRGMIQL